MCISGEGEEEDEAGEEKYDYDYGGMELIMDDDKAQVPVLLVVVFVPVVVLVAVVVVRWVSVGGGTLKLTGVRRSRHGGFFLGPCSSLFLVVVFFTFSHSSPRSCLSLSLGFCSPPS